MSRIYVLYRLHAIGPVAYFERKRDLQKVLNKLPANEYHGEVHIVHRFGGDGTFKAQQILNNEFVSQTCFKDEVLYLYREIE